MTRELLEQALEALDLSQALLERSAHHPKILCAYEAVRAQLSAQQARTDEVWVDESLGATPMVGYDILRVYSKQKRKPMTGTEVMDEYIKTGRFDQFVEAFFAGAKCAEDFHGIKETP